MLKKQVIVIAIALHAVGAIADNLTLPLQKHTVECLSREVCPLRKPEGVGGWELLSKEVVLEEKGGGYWLADFSKAKSNAAGRAILRVLAASGQIVEVQARFPRGGK